MTENQLFRAIGDIDDKKIESAFNYRGEKRYHLYKHYIKIAAACIPIIFMIFILQNRYWSTDRQIDKNLSSTIQRGNNSKSEEIVSEKFVVCYKNKKYYYSGMEISKNKIGKYLEKNIVAENMVKKRECVLYEVQGKNTETEIAVKIDNSYYLYIYEDK